MGYVEYPIVGLASGFASVSDLSSNRTNPVPMSECVVPGSHPPQATYAGQLVIATVLAATDCNMLICQCYCARPAWGL